MRVLSVFDGISCGMMAFRKAGVPVEEYHAFEIDPHAVRCSQHNFPEVIRHGDGDVFKADFRQFKGVDFLIGGSPCTYWSVAQKKDVRETEAHGMGWELFQQYVRALMETKPRYFIYENNKSMAPAIKKEISETFGFGPVMINSALVSAQNRERYYWVGRRMDDGSYAKVKVEQPEDMHLVLKDVLDSGYADRDKGHAVIASAGRTTYREYFLKNQGNVALESATDSERTIYDVKDGMITIKGKQYPIKLPDGSYIIRKLSVDECERLQTIPNVKESVMFNLIDDSVEVEKWFIEHQSNRAQSVGEKCHKSQKLAENVENIDLLEFVQYVVSNSSTKPLQIEEPAHLNVHISSEVVSNPKDYFTELKKNASTVVGYSDCLIANQIDVFVRAIAGISMLLEKTTPLGKVDVLRNGRSIVTLRNGKMSSNISGKEMMELVNSVGTDVNTVMKAITSITSNPGQNIPNIDQTLITLYSYVKSVIGSSTLSKTWTSVSFTIERRYTATLSNTQAYKCIGNGWTVNVIVHLIESAMRGDTDAVQTRFC